MAAGVPSTVSLYMEGSHYMDGIYAGRTGSGNDRYRRAPYRGDSYAPRPTPYDRPAGGRSRDLSSSQRTRRIEEVFEGNELMPFEQFARYHGIEASDLEQAYRDYVRRHRRAALERFFSQHKNESWFVEQYDAFKAQDHAKQVDAAAQGRSEEFKRAMDEGILQQLSLEDGSDLQVEGEKPAEDYSKIRSFPASMRIPDRLTGCLVRRAHSIVALSNIAPSVARESLVETLQSCSEKFLSLELGEPMAEKGFYRLGWATFKDDADLSAIAAAIEANLINGEKIYCAPLKSFSLQIKIADPAFSLEKRIRQDAANAKSLVHALDSLHGITTWLFEKCAEKEAEDKFVLDCAIVYLRHVHYCCFYSALICQGPNDLTRLCGDLYVRTPSAASGGASETGDSTGAFTWTIEDLVDRLSFKYDPVTEDSMLEKHVAKVDEGRYRCIHCSKLFKGPEYVVKHLRLKHEDVVKSAVLESAMFNSLLARPCPCAILPLPLRRRRSQESLPPLPTTTASSSSNSLHSRSEHRTREPFRPRRPPPPPRDAPQDPRQLRQYQDWDAPATGDIQISYE